MNGTPSAPSSTPQPQPKAVADLTLMMLRLMAQSIVPLLLVLVALTLLTWIDLSHQIKHQSDTLTSAVQENLRTQQKILDGLDRNYAAMVRLGENDRVEQSQVRYLIAVTPTTPEEIRKARKLLLDENLPEVPGEK